MAGGDAVWVGLLGKKASAATMKPAAQLSPKLAPTHGLVLADWLEEHGEEGAVAKLREAFSR